MLFFDIRKNRNLAAKRNPAFERNRFAKIMGYLASAIWAAYLVFIGVMLPFALDESFPNMEPYHILNQTLAIFLAVDFFVRLMFPLPVQEIKPYLLLPVPKKKVMSAFLLHEALHPFNLIWLCLFVPFALLTVTRFYGLAGVAGYCSGIWLLMVTNCFWSMLMRTMKRQKFAYFLWVIPAYGMLALLEYLPAKGLVSSFSMDLGEAFILWNPWAFLGTLAGIALLGWINYKVQLHCIYSELARTDGHAVRHISDYAFFDRYGNVGEYMRLELKMILRNKVPRNQFWTCLAATFLFTLALSFDVYGTDSLMNRFICLTAYCNTGLFMLNHILSFEGNYIDGLMVRKESLHDMLRAKYYFQCILLAIPFLLFLIPVGMGRLPLLTSAGFLFFTAGVVFAAMMQTAAYNGQTIPLDNTVTAKSRTSNGYQQMVAIGSITVPLLIPKGLMLFVSEGTAYCILMFLGIAGLLTHRLWIRNIYARLMKRRYANMEGFRNTR